MSRDGAHPVRVGVILGAHGVRGDVRVKSLTAVAEDCFGYGVLASKEGEPLLDPVQVRPARTHFIVTPRQPREKEGWDALSGTELFVPRANLPETEADEAYFGDLVDLEAKDPDGGVLGRVHAVHDFGAGDILEILPADGGTTVMVPFTEADIPELDVSAGVLTIASWALWRGEEEG